MEIEQDTYQFITFRIDNNLIGINILNIREINRVLEITPVQQAPEYVRGLVNLRGQAVTVFDLGVRLGMAPREITSETQNIIFKNKDVGILVDSISDVIEARTDEIEPRPANISGIKKKFIKGVIKLDDELMIILSHKKILEYNAVPAKMIESKISA